MGCRTLNSRESTKRAKTGGGVAQPPSCSARPAVGTGRPRSSACGSFAQTRQKAKGPIEDRAKCLIRMAARTGFEPAS